MCFCASARKTMSVPATATRSSSADPSVFRARATVRTGVSRCLCVRVCARVYIRMGQTVKPETTKGTLCLQKRAVGSAFRVMSSYYSNSDRVMRLGAPRISFPPRQNGAFRLIKKNAQTKRFSQIHKSRKIQKKNRENTFLPEIRH